ncbi:MAG: response regulator [Mucilaginibacter polytrichastri]|nr:response regulator [Mucilaginibacter polytrichastri]
MHNKKILIIDDDARNTFALGLILRTKNYDCLTQQSALAGLQILEEHNDIGIVLLDMMMPGMDGYETIGIIKNNHKISHVPVVAVTAQAMPGDREKCLAAGADAYISKPVDVDKLLVILKERML